jgi:hypothetical protein
LAGLQFGLAKPPRPEIDFGLTPSASPGLMISGSFQVQATISETQRSPTASKQGIVLFPPRLKCEESA